MERPPPELAKRRLKGTATAGGVNPPACAQAVADGARRAGLTGKLKIGVVTGDDLLGRLDDLIARGHTLANLDTREPITAGRVKELLANAYLVAWPVVDAPVLGAHI